MPASPHKNTTRAPLTPFGWREMLLTTGGLGFLRPAPGTWGSLPPVALAIVLAAFNTSVLTYHLALGAVLVVFSVACVALGPFAAVRLRRPDLAADAKANADAPEVVADETAGQALALMVWPYFLLRHRAGEPIEWSLAQPASIAAELAPLLFVFGTAFVMFRLFDIIKPWPCNALEKLPRGWGVLADDLMAGVYALVATTAVGGLYHAFIEPMLTGR